jgi:PIN domain nuclease of toxin-antitoxin system
VNLLLDTNVLLWALMDDARLTGAGRDVLLDGRNRVLVSQAIVESLTLVTADRTLGRYEADLLQA